MGQKIQLSESQLRKLIKESVKKALMNEISSDMIRRAHDKFVQKYGTEWPDYKVGTDSDKLEKRNFGTTWEHPIHPKDKRPIGRHIEDYKNAYIERKGGETIQDPIVKKAWELYHKVKWDEENIEVDDSTIEGNPYIGISGDGYIWGSAVDKNGEEWEFYAKAPIVIEDGRARLETWGPYDFENVEFKAPDGTEGKLPNASSFEM
jgi:hypothetical protein